MKAQSTDNQGTKTATYKNIATDETYTLGGIRDLEHAWNLAKFVAERNNWNLSMFCQDVKVSVN